MFKENGTRIPSAAGVEFRHLHFPHNERSLVLRNQIVFTDPLYFMWMYNASYAIWMMNQRSRVASAVTDFTSKRVGDRANFRQRVNGRF
jgi:hypothetical protein